MSKVVSIRLPDALYRELRQHARMRGMEPSVAARDLIRRGLGIDAHESLEEEARIAARRELFGRLNGAAVSEE